MEEIELKCTMCDGWITGLCGCAVTREVRADRMNQLTDAVEAIERLLTGDATTRTGDQIIRAMDDLYVAARRLVRHVE